MSEFVEKCKAAHSFSFRHVDEIDDRNIRWLVDACKEIERLQAENDKFRAAINKAREGILEIIQPNQAQGSREAERQRNECG